jgi:membrane protease YdiL (CAAX protease family)
VAYHLFFVAIPEELFYRGYVQSRLDEVWTPGWRVFGAVLGPGWLVTSLVFALGHSVVLFQWWHLAIFVPSLAFGWLRARTGGVLAGAFFHAWCNVMVAFLDAAWGVSTG